MDREAETKGGNIFEEYPDVKKIWFVPFPADDILKNTIKDAARLAMARWYYKVEEARMHSLTSLLLLFGEHYDEILNFYNHRSSNAMAESFNAKIKLFRANLRGVVDKRFFLSALLNYMRIPTKSYSSRNIIKKWMK